MSITGLVAGGCNVICFTTGRGSVFGCKPVPSIKLATNSLMYRHLEEDMDINCGVILEGTPLPAGRSPDLRGDHRGGLWQAQQERAERGGGGRVRALDHRPGDVARPGVARVRPAAPGLGHRWLAYYKFGSGALLFLVGVEAIRLLHADVRFVLEHWVAWFHADRLRYVQTVLGQIGPVSSRDMLGMSLASFAYSGLQMLEGIGLYLERRWAEYLALLGTGGFLPIELYELAHAFSWTKLGVLVFNALIVAYLVRLLLAGRLRTGPR